jgi:hypothetical protein
MKLTQLLKENEERPLSNEVKKHFLEIVSTYNKYQESMDRKSDITQVAETLGGITEAARTLAIQEAGDWFDKHTVKRNMSELDKLGKQFDKVALEARALDQRMAGLYEDMGHILSRYYKFGEITEDQMKERLGIKESANKSINEAVSKILKYKSQKGDINIEIEEDPAGIFVDVKMKGKGFNSLLSTTDIEFPSGHIKVTPRVKRIPIKESVEDCGCGSLNETPVMVSKRNGDGSITTTLKESDLNEEEMKLYEFGQKVETLMEKSCPTDQSKWGYYKSQAKKKFDVYPSAYANGWAAKQYKAAGGGWKNC